MLFCELANIFFSLPPHLQHRNNMAFLGRLKKSDLKILCEELNIDVLPEHKIIDMKNLIVNADNYDEELTKAMFETVLSDRLEREREEKERQKEEKEREEREFELRKLELQSQSTARPQPLVSNSSHKLTVELPKFDSKEGDISLYLVLFERQARRANISEENWVSALLNLLPYDITQLIAREDEDNCEDYDHIKGLLLQRFKLSPENFRQKFTQHIRTADKSFKDYVFELRTFFEEWITGLGITTFEELKNLIITDQLKRRTPAEIKEHFVDEWTKFIKPSELAERLDEYESVRSVRKKTYQTGSHGFKKYEPHSPKPTNSWRTKKPAEEPSSRTTPPTPSQAFERRKVPRCYVCSSTSHLRPECPKLKKNCETVASHGIDGSCWNESLLPYTSLGKVNGVQIPILRDTGATIDLVCRKLIKPHMFLKERVWIKTPLFENLACLPLAEVELECNLGHIITKAAVLGDSLDQGRYLLGNKTAELLKQITVDKTLEVHMMNAVETRNQKNLRESKVERVVEEAAPEDNLLLEDEEDILPEVEPEFFGSDLIKVSPNEFKEAQKRSEDLKPLFELARQPSAKENKYVLHNDMLFYQKKDKDGTERRLLVVPEQFREALKKLCHEGTTAHLGVSKTKDALVKNFFWPSCYKDIENFVKTCDPCQRVGKPNDKKKAPLKLVPVISEIFTKINVDACGPLPITPAGNRYLITAICMSSRYPDAIPVPDICSPTVVDALMHVFSRLGFPRELQSDQGTSFVSELTTEFLERFGIKIRHSSVRHPQSNPVERFHRTFKRIIRVLCLESGPDWEKHVPYALFALRTVPHASTGFTPAELVHGRNLRTPMSLLYENLTEQEVEENTVVGYVFDLINRMKRCQELAVEHMEDSQQKRKFWYDRKSVKRVFQEGDQVLVITPSRANKLSVEWMGPGIVEKQLSETNYVIRFPEKDKTHVYHVNMLKPYFQRPESVNLLCLEPAVSPETDDEEDIPYIKLKSSEDEMDQVFQDIEENSRLTAEQKDQLEVLLSTYASIFSNEPGCTDLMQHDIELETERPVCAKPYRMSPRQTEILKTEVSKMLELGVIEVGESDFTSPLILVEVPGKEARPCIDYRRLNKVTRTQFFPLPNLEQRIETVSAARYISLLDLTRGYWQIPLSKRAQRYAAFVTSFGTYRPLRMPFGLKNAPYNFSLMMAEILKGCDDFALPYLDDIAIFSENWEDHLTHLDCVLQKIRQAKLNVKPSKCKFSQSHVKYLGHLVGQGQRTPGEIKVKAIQDFPEPTSKTEIRAFLGLAGYYRKYIPSFSVVSAPLSDQLKGKNRKGKIIWDDKCQKAFLELKERLSRNPILYAPDFSKPFILQCDASNLGIGIVLSQVNDHGEEHPILYLSKKFSIAEQKYGTTEKECAAIIFAVKKLQCYLDNQQTFQIQTDHNPLVWLHQNMGTNPRLLRWSLSLQHLNYQVVHKKGKHHQNADSLSRVP